MNKKSVIITITGPSGSGKSHLEASLCQGEFHKAVSFTTREPRPGEINGKDYNFIKEDELKALLHGGGVVEHVEFSGNNYGLLRSDIVGEKPVVAVVEPNGLIQIAKYCDKHDIEHVCVFLKNSTDVLVDRFLSRYESTGIPKEELVTVRKRIGILLNKELHWASVLIENDVTPDVTGIYNEQSQQKMIDDILECVEQLSNVTGKPEMYF